MHTHSFTRAAVLALIAAGCPLAAGAASTRAWVSGHGVDAAGCGAPTSPCRSLQYAHDNAVIAGGEIDILDPAGYGAIVITKSVSIVNDGVGTAGVQASGGADAITINAGTDDFVYLRGLNVDGVFFTGGNGVVVDGGARVTIVGCTFRHFQHHGVLVAPGPLLTHVVIVDSTSADNGGEGLHVELSAANAQVTVEADHLVATGDSTGVHVLDARGSGSVGVVLSGLNASSNFIDGVAISASNTPDVDVTLDNAQINLNSLDGLFVADLALVHLSRSVINQNGGDGVENSTDGSGGVFSTGDNQVRDNAAGNVPTPLTTQPLF